MPANAALTVIANAFARPELVPYISDASELDKETEGLSASSAENLRLAKGFLTAIDFEIAAAHSLCRPWHDEPNGEVYLNRSLERISEHMTALKAIHSKLSPSRDGKPFLT
ncbi:MAG: hypothetical protein WBQ94_01705 [Terracidiphilus sp.]